MSHVAPALPVTLADLDIALADSASARHVARVVMECITLARRSRPNADFWLNVAYRGLSKRDRPSCDVIRSLRRQLLDAEDELNVRVAV